MPQERRKVEEVKQPRDAEELDRLREILDNQRPVFSAKSLAERVEEERRRIAAEA